MPRLPWWLSHEPRLEVDLAGTGIDLTKAQRVERGERQVPPTRLDAGRAAALELAKPEAISPEGTRP